MLVEVLGLVLLAVSGSVLFSLAKILLAFLQGE